MKNIIGLIALACLALLLTRSSEAKALSTIYGYNDNGHQYIGHITHDTLDSQWLCDDGPFPGDVSWTNLGTSAGLNDDYSIHADASSGTGGDDWIEIIRATRTLTGECAGSWSGLLYNMHYLDIHGDGGNDAAVIGGSGDTYAYGDDGNDYVYQYSGLGRTYGGLGNDNVFGNSGSGDRLYGQGGDDCLQDGNNSWSVYDCGSGTADRWYLTNTAAGKIGCEQRENFCCGFC